MMKRKLPLGVTESRTEPWFRYSRGQLIKPRYFYYGATRSKAEARAQVVAFAMRENKKWTPKIEAARKGRLSKTNQSGVVGVSIKVEKGRIRGSRYHYWWARWPGCPAGVKFSILQHDEKKAFCLALIARELETQDKQSVEREYLARKKSGRLRPLLKAKAQTA
jgi:hypothetical protein